MLLASKRKASTHSSLPSIQARTSRHQTHLHNHTTIMSASGGSVFSALNLSKRMYQSLPKEPTPHLKNPYDAIALLCHACMLAVGFRIIGLGEDHKIGTPQYKGPSGFAKLTGTRIQIRGLRRPTPAPRMELLYVRRLRLPLRSQPILPPIPPQSQPPGLQSGNQLPGDRRRQSAHL